MDPVLAVVVAAVAVGAFAQSLTGFGFSLVAAPVCAVVLGPHDGIRIAATMAVLIDLLVLVRDRHLLDRRALGRILAPALAVLPLAVATTRLVPGPVLVVVAGTVTLACVAVMAWPANAAAGGERAGGGGGWALAGAASGAMGVTVGLAGPPLALQSLRTGRPVTSSRSTLAAFFLVIDAAAVVTRGAPGPDAMVLTSLVAVGGGFAAGLAAGRHIPDRWVRSGVLALAAGAAVAALAGTLA